MNGQLEYPTETIKEFVIAAHGDVDKVQAMLAEDPRLLNLEFDWGPGGREDGLAAAAHMGHRAIAEYLLAQGAPATICAVAMLGERDQVESFLQGDGSLANARGAHGIPVLFHAAMSGQVPLAELLQAYGCNEGYNHALHGAIAFGHTAMVAWLLSHGVTDVDVPDFQNQTPLQRATAMQHLAIVDLLRQHGARDSTAENP